MAVPVWGGVRYKDLYPGIDLEITGENGQLVQRLVVRPGADLSAVRLRVEGADSVALLPSDRGARGEVSGGLRLETAVGDFILPLLEVEMGDKEPAFVQEVGARAFEVSHPFTAGGGSVRILSSMVHS